MWWENWPLIASKSNWNYFWRRQNRKENRNSQIKQNKAKPNWDWKIGIFPSKNLSTILEEPRLEFGRLILELWICQPKLEPRKNFHWVPFRQNHPIFRRLFAFPLAFSCNTAFDEKQDWLVFLSAVLWDYKIFQKRELKSHLIVKLTPTFIRNVVNLNSRNLRRFCLHIKFPLNFFAWNHATSTFQIFVYRWSLQQGTLWGWVTFVRPQRPRSFPFHFSTLKAVVK